MSNNQNFRWITTAWLAGSLLAIATLKAESNYEYEPMEGLHEEEWYDPSDWFDDDFDQDPIDVEESWASYPGYYYTSPDPYFDYIYFEYGPFYTWDADRGKWARTDAYAGDMIESGDVEHAGISLSGTIEGFRTVTLSDQSDSASEDHTLVRLRFDRAMTTVVDLGPKAELERFDLDSGDRVTIEGTYGIINDKSVLMAERVRVDGTDIEVDRENLRRSEKEA